MSKLLKSLSVVMASMLIFTVFQTPVKALEIKSAYLYPESINPDNKLEVPTLTKGEIVTKKIRLSNGQYADLTVEKIEDSYDELKENLNTSMLKTAWTRQSVKKNVADGTYKISVSAFVVSAGFKVKIKKHKITKAYDPWHWAIVTNVSGSLKKDSSKKATYYMNFNMAIPWLGGPSWTGGVQARIEGKNLSTYME